MGFDNLTAPYCGHTGIATGGSPIASAATIAPAPDGDRADVTGTTTISAILTNSRPLGTLLLLRFTGSLTLTHSANLYLRGAANYTTNPGDELIFEVIGVNQYRQAALANLAGPGTYADASAPANTVYYSTDQTKLCYKDAGGTSHALY